MIMNDDNTQDSRSGEEGKNAESAENFDLLLDKKRKKKGREKRSRSVKRKAGILCIVLGAVTILYFLWINYYGIIYHEIYSFMYEHFYEGKIDEYSTMFSIEDIPDFLIAGSTLIPDRENPAIEGIPPETEAAEESEVGSAEETEEIPAPAETESPETESPETEAPETEAREKVLWIMPKVSAGRDDYTGGMYMSVPRLGVSWSEVRNGTDSKALGRGPGMYDLSDIPTVNMDDDVNLVIAGHRDGVRANFYNMHKMKAGDLIYVYMNNLCYTYEYEETLIVEKDDWSVTLRRGYSCITLTTCHPPGKNSQRMVVFGKLIKIQEYLPLI